MLIALLNNVDRVRIACLAQLVNVIAPIMTAKGGPAWRQTIFHPFAQASRSGRGAVLRQVLDSPVYDTTDRSDVPYLASACVYDSERGTLTLFAVNRSLEQPLPLSMVLRGFERVAVEEWSVLRHRDLEAVNTRDKPDEVRPVLRKGARVERGVLAARLPPASWNVIRMRCSGAALR
jgi:alpha-N-arabinofuranosidase